MLESSGNAERSTTGGPGDDPGQPQTIRLAATIKIESASRVARRRAKSEGSSSVPMFDVTESSSPPAAAGSNLDVPSAAPARGLRQLRNLADRCVLFSMFDTLRFRPDSA
jgi:hypothetical protein